MQDSRCLILPLPLKHIPAGQNVCPWEDFSDSQVCMLLAGLVYVRYTKVKIHSQLPRSKLKKNANTLPELKEFFLI